MTPRDVSKPTSRRRLLKALGGSAVVAGLAGCSGDTSDGDGESSDDGETNPDDDGSGASTDDGDTQTPTEEEEADEETATPTDDEATPTESEDTQTPTEEESDDSSGGGDASFVGNIQTTERSHDVWDEFESLTVAFERIVLERENGDPIELSVGSDIDLVSLERGESETYVEETPIPSGTYTSANLYMPVQSATMADGSEPSQPFEGFDPVPIELETFDEYVEVESGGSIEFTASLILVETYQEDAWTFSTGFSVFYG